MAAFADIILPLPLPGRFTYSVPEELCGSILPGCRVYVQFGRKKFFTGIVDTLHDRKPTDYDVKPIMALLDAEPSVIYPQRKFWDWLADYYLCAVGDVFKAALPSGLKVESETFVALSPDFEGEEKLTEVQALIVAVLQQSKKITLGDLQTKLSKHKIARPLNSLMERGIIAVSENAVERYHTRKERCIRLTLTRGDSEGLHRFFDLVTRSQKQQKALLAYLDLSRWLHVQKELTEVTRKQLQEHTGITPGIVKALIDKGIFEEYTRTVNRFAPPADSGREINLSPLTPPQKEALDTIHASFLSHNVCLLHGVTGSGKTEIYTHLMREALSAGNQVLYLVPEISLTTQLTDRLRKVFGQRLLVYHSKFNDSERVDIWKRVLASNDPLIVIGVRSSVFLPFRRLGLVIVDEEHDSSFKQQDPAPRYNGRDAAIVLASMHGAKTLLGSATPSVETFFKASAGKYGLATLTERFQGATLPNVEIVDMKDQRKRRLSNGILSSPLRIAMHRSLGQGRQGLLFQNRRGFAPYIVCRECGWTPKCINCDVSPVYHKTTNKLHCHYCGYSAPPPAVCPACGLNSIEVYGYGTERIADEVHNEFQGYRVARMDLDTTRNKSSYQEIIEEFGRHETDILVGTQMVTKGLDFGDVETVGVLNADALLNFPDFRSAERAFNILEQVAGRAGRRPEMPGTVVIQTTDPGNPILARVAAHDFPGYYAAEIQERQRYGYPPFTRIINIYIKHRDENTARALAVSYTLALKKIFGPRVLGPEKPFVARISKWYLQQIMLKVEADASMKKVKKLLRDLYIQFAGDPRLRAAQLYYDVDPV